MKGERGRGRRRRRGGGFFEEEGKTFLFSDSMEAFADGRVDKHPVAKGSW